MSYSKIVPARNLKTFYIPLQECASAMVYRGTYDGLQRNVVKNSSNNNNNKHYYNDYCLFHVVISSPIQAAISKISMAGA